MESRRKYPAINSSKAPCSEPTVPRVMITKNTNKLPMKCIPKVSMCTCAFEKSFFRIRCINRAKTEMKGSEQIAATAVVNNEMLGLKKTAPITSPIKSVPNHDNTKWKAFNFFVFIAARYLFDIDSDCNKC